MVIKKGLLVLTMLTILSGCTSNNENNNNSNVEQKEETRVMHNESIYNDGVNFDSSCWNKPQSIFDETLDNNQCKGLFIRSDYNNEESYAFAYLGIPEQPSSSKLPAVLLLHGGGGTAYYEWVKEWVKKGFVALAVDLEGHIPNKDGTINDMPADLYKNSIYKAPHNSNLGDANEDLSKTWLHYACRTAIIANSFLHNLDYVDNYKIGVCGISWGGFITSIITGYDDRFAFSIPMYCTIMCEESGTPIGGYIKSHPVFRVFDKMEPISLVNTPIKMIFSDCDTHCNPLYASDLISFTKNGNIAVIPGFLHSHGHALAQSEPFNFALDVINKTNNVKFVFADNLCVVDLPTNKKMNYVTITYTKENSISNTTRWNTKEIESSSISRSSISYSLKEDAKYFYLSFVDEKGSVYSSFIQTIK